MAGEKNIIKDNTENKMIDWKAITIRFLFTAGLITGLLFISAGQLDWWEGWVYMIYTIGTLIVSRIVLIIKFPETAKERMSAAKKENVKSWDKFLVPIVAWSMPMVAWVVAGLDVRFGWSPELPDSLQIAAFVVSCAGSLFSTWAMFANQFFSSHVRIQTDRGHTVTSNGPYRFVRHPGYAGAIISWIATVLFFGSYWMAIPVVFAIIAFIVRTALEDRTLQEELSGYREYTQEVRYRLFPGIW